MKGLTNTCAYSTAIIIAVVLVVALMIFSWQGLGPLGGTSNLRSSLSSITIPVEEEEYKAKLASLDKRYTEVMSGHHLTKNVSRVLDRQYHRMGYTESTVLFFYILEHNMTIEQQQGEVIVLPDAAHAEYLKLLNWLYTTSGFYDHTIPGSYFDFDTNLIRRSPVYNFYVRKLAEVINGSLVNLLLNSVATDCGPRPQEVVKKYLNFTPNAADLSPSTFFAHLDKKRVLFVSPFASLLVHQVTSGNAAAIHGATFPNILAVHTYTPPYTFFNNKYRNGTHHEHNYFDTLFRMCRQLSSRFHDKEIDVAVVSAGSYSPFLTHYLAEHFGTEVVAMGGQLTKFFGIANARDKAYAHESNTTLFPPSQAPYWITNIPDAYKPQDYTKIEGGCYW